MGFGKRLIRHRYFRLFLLISLAIHVVGIVFFVAQSFKKRATTFMLPKSNRHTHRVFLTGSNNHKKFVLPPKTTPTKRLQLPPKRVAKLTAPRSQFGWVFFDEPPLKQTDNQKITTGIPTTTDGDVIAVKRARATENNPKKAEAMHIKVTKTIKQPAAEQSLALTKETKTEDKPVALTEHTQEEKHQAPEPANQPVTQPAQSTRPIITETKTAEPPTPTQSIEDRIERIKAINAAISNRGHMPAPVTTQNATPTTTEGKEGPVTTIAQDGQAEGADAARIRGATQNEGQPMPKRNIIALTKGFIEKLDGENGTDLIDRDGDPSIKADLNEMRYLSYESKITWSLQAAWKQNFCYRSTRQIPEGEAIIEFTVDENGNLTNSVLLQSTGNTELDTMIMKTTKYASPFPPLPRHLGVKQYTTGRIIQVRSHRYNF